METVQRGPAGFEKCFLHAVVIYLYHFSDFVGAFVADAVIVLRLKTKRACRDSSRGPKKFRCCMTSLQYDSGGARFTLAYYMDNFI